MKKIFPFLVAIFAIASCTNHGNKISERYLEVYYKDGVTEQQAQKVFDYLLPLWEDKGENTSKKSVQLTRTGDTINFRMVSRMEVMEKMDESLFYTMGNELSGVLNDAPVNLVLTDNSFKELRTYTYKKPELPEFGEKVSSGNIEVYVDGGMDMKTGRDLANFLNDQMAPDDIISFQLQENNEGFVNVRMVSSEEKAKDITYESIAEFLESMSQKVFDGNPIIMDFTDTQFKTIKTFEHKAQDYRDGKPPFN